MQRQLIGYLIFEFSIVLHFVNEVKLNFWSKLKKILVKILKCLDGKDKFPEIYTRESYFGSCQHLEAPQAPRLAFSCGDILNQDRIQSKILLIFTFSDSDQI